MKPKGEGAKARVWRPLNFIMCLKVNRKTALLSDSVPLPSVGLWRVRSITDGDDDHDEGDEEGGDVHICVCVPRACVCVCSIGFCAQTDLRVHIMEGVCIRHTVYKTLRVLLTPPPFSILCKWKCKAIFGGSWCHKWFERRAYNCWSRFVWQSDKPWTAPVTDLRSAFYWQTKDKVSTFTFFLLLQGSCNTFLIFLMCIAIVVLKV